MKALSIKQPWAWLIVNGFKDIENREWKTNFRGRFLVHAGQKFDFDGWQRVQQMFPHIIMPQMGANWSANAWELGGFVGEAEIKDCVMHSDSPWFSGTYGLMIENAKPMTFRPWRGALGFFNATTYLVSK